MSTENLDLLHTKLRNLKMFSQDIKQCKLALNDLNSLTDLKKGVQKLIESEAEDVAEKVSKLVQDSMP